MASRRLAVTATLDEGDARLHRIARQRFDRKHERALHKSMDHQPVLIGIDFRDAGVAAFEMQPGWRDHSFEHVQRRA